MLTPARLLRRVLSLFTTRKFDAELDAEMQFHVEMEIEKRVKAGEDRQRAREATLRDFGGVSRHRDDSRDARGVRAVEEFVQDVRVGSRSLSRQLTYTLVAVGTLAIGIGATTALWSAVYRVLLQPFPFAEANRIVQLQEEDTRSPGRTSEVSPGNFVDWKERNRAFDLMAAAEPFGFDWIGPDGPLSFQVALVTQDFFTIQGLRPLLGRVFRPDEFVAGQDQVVLLTETLWRNRFGADSSLVGRILTLDSIPRLVVGVMTSDAMAPYGAEMWAPKVFRPNEQQFRTSRYWQVMARLANGVTMTQAREDMQRVAGQLAAEFPATNRNSGVNIQTLREAIAGSSRRTMLVLFAAVGFVLLIACVNVANLQLAESVRRQRELAIRTAIGAGHGRLVRQLLTESLVVTVSGAAVGLFIAWAGIAAIRAFAPADLWLLRRLEFDTAALVSAGTLALAAAFMVSIMPVIAAGRIHLSDSLSAGRRTGSLSRHGRKANRVLVVSEVALALVLMVGAGLLLRSLGQLLRSERGYRPEGVMIATLQAWGYYPTPAARAEFARYAQERLAALPGVERVGMTSALPLAWPIGLERVRVRIEGNEPAPGDELPSVRATATNSGYFDALGIRLVRGRQLSANDLAGSTPVVLVNAAFVRQFFGDADPIGKRVTLGFMGPPTPREIVGVVGDVRHEGLQAPPAPTVFLPHAQASTGAMHFVMRVAGDPANYERVVRAEFTAMNGAMPIGEVTTMNALLRQSLTQRRFQLGLLGAFSVIALLLSAIGIYGVMSRVTSERTHEIGVRLAIGADRGDVRMMVLRNGGVLAVTGIGIGTALALVLTRSMAGMLYEVTPLDPVTYVAAGGTLLAVALAASWIPAWRASAVDPVVALRND